MPGMVMPGDPKPDNEQSKPETEMSGDVAKSNNADENKKSTPMLLKIDVDMDFTMQLNTVYDQYIVLKNDFVLSDEKKVTQAAQKVQQVLSDVDMELLSGDAHTKWMEISGNLNNQLKIIVSSGKLEDQRIAFAIFNDNFYKGIKTFGLMGKTVFYQFCPMMNKGIGAYWLSETSDIRNPYYGESMLTCGETKEILKY